MATTVKVNGQSLDEGQYVVHVVIFINCLKVKTVQNIAETLN